MVDVGVNVIFMENNIELLIEKIDTLIAINEKILEILEKKLLPAKRSLLENLTINSTKEENE